MSEQQDPNAPETQVEVEQFVAEAKARGVSWEAVERLREALAKEAPKPRADGTRPQRPTLTLPKKSPGTIDDAGKR